MSENAGRGEWQEERRARARYGAVEVVVGERGVDAALRLFKRLVLKDGILQTLRRHAYYEKPGDRRRRKVREATRRRRKAERRALMREARQRDLPY